MSEQSLSERIAKLSPVKRALLEQRLRERSASTDWSIPRREATAAAVPLSFGQERLWFLNQLEPDSPAYNESRAVSIKGNLDVAALEYALNQIIDRHQALRTTFIIEDGIPLQAITEERSFTLRVIDLSAFPHHDREGLVHDYLQEAFRQPFDLSRDLLLRALLLRLAPREFLLTLVMHHIASDGWSSAILAQELEALYEASVSKRTPALAPLPIQYADYAVWQRAWLSGTLLERQLSYWKQQLDGLAPLGIAPDFPRPVVQSHIGAKLSVDLPNDLVDRLRALSRHEGVTLFMTVLAAFQALLCRYTGATDVAVGSPVAGRTRAETERLIGFFVNTLVLRTDLSGDPPFRELLKRVREVALGAYAHQELPFEKLVEELKPERSLADTPLFQVMFALQNVPRHPLRFTGLEVNPVEIDSTAAKFDLFMALVEDEQRLGARLIYNTGLFQPATANRFLAHFVNILGSIVADPDSRLSKLSLLSAAEKRQQLVDWNQTRKEYPGDRCIHQLFEEQAELNPDATAVIFDDQQITYRELNRQANQVAHYLQKRGVGPESIVAVCIERSLAMVVGLFGILKAGGAYLPLDPAYPRDRLAFMLADTRASLLLTQQSLREKLAPDRVTMVCLDSDRGQIVSESVQNSDNGAKAENLAYIIYTSGSTGRPKGVAIQHRSAVAFLSWARTVFTEAELAGVLASTSICFDLSVFELFAPLSCGGKTIIAPNALGLCALPAASQVRLINTVPSAIGGLLRLNAIPPSVSTINLAGEPLKTNVVKNLYEKTSASKVYDLYGPSEDTTYSTFALRVGAGPETIGRPISNTQAFILDRYGEPVPLGISGELYLGGDGLARGYLNRPELTAERFVPNPFSDQPGARLYRTGDRARYLPDGQIEFLGRTDNQIKVRGYRIELGEIETVLTQHPAVAASAVILREDAPGEKRLAAYVVAGAGREATVNQLRSFLQHRLPEYMIPSAFVVLDSLPLSVNGKVNRRALPAPGQSSVDPGGTYKPPRTPAEEMVAEIWREVLKVERVGIEDNFFDLGGHSLLATQVMSRVRAVLRLEVPLRTIFETPTVAGLAEWIEQRRHNGQPVHLPALVAAPRQDSLPLSFAQQRLWFLDQLEPGKSVYNIPGAVRIRGALDDQALEQSLNEIVRRHEVLRTTFSTIQGEPVQIIASSERICLQRVDLSGGDEIEREKQALRLAREEASRPFDLSCGPLLRVTLISLAREDHIFLLSMHHIVSDGWSMGVFYRELSICYEAFSHGKPPPLTELAIQYVDFALWQREWLRGEVFEAQLEYWRKQLANLSPLQLPTDRPRPALQTYRGAREIIELDHELTANLKALARKHDVTLFMTLLAAFQTLLYRYTGQVDIALGSPIANRNHAEIENLIGFFVNTLVFRSDLSGNPTFVEFLGRVREVALGAYAHQDVPFEKLVDDLQPERRLSHSPLFQVMFVLQNAPSGNWQIPGLSFDSLGVDTATSKFDLLLALNESTGRLKASLEYNTDLFDKATMERMLGHFKVLLTEISAGPERRLNQFSFIGEVEKSRLVVEWNHTERDFPAGKRIDELFNEQAERSPDVFAVVIEDQRLTYRELNARANQLAHYLQGLGVGPDTLVAICLERTPEMAVAVLGVLKAGGAYVPLDPDYPTDRLAFMLADSRSRVLLATRRVLERLPAYDGSIVCLDGEWELVSRHNEETPVSAAAAENLAYAIYTSGSTGRPKAVAMSHRSLVNLISWQRRQSSNPLPPRTLQFASLSFDVSFQEMFATWCAGGTLVLIPELLRRDSVGFLRYLRDQSIERLFVPFVGLQQLAEAAEQEGFAPPTLREIITAGEQLQITRTIAGFFNQLEQCTLHNQYGPSESHVVTAFTLTGPADSWSALPAIGRPVSNTKIFLLDQNLNPVPVGIHGELYIGGEALARGYVNGPELTAEKFIPDPFSSEPGARLYKTGDVARYLPDGNIEFLGRVDHQVKIRGYRIELGEVGATINQHPAVHESVVVVDDALFDLKREPRDPGARRLIAYVVLSSDTDASVAELRSFLREKLPDYMIPSSFVFLDALPLTPNGKLDRRALPAWNGSRADSASIYQTPRTPVEEMVAEIWREVLKVEQVGVEDNFFDLGGHSLLATQVMSRVRTVLRLEVPLRTMFETPTVAGVAEWIEQWRHNGQPVHLPALTAAPRQDPLPLSFAQQRLWFLDQLEPGRSVYNIPEAVRIRGALDCKALEQSLNEIVRRHEVLRTTFSTVEGEPVQIIAPSQKISLQRVDLSGHDETEREKEARRLAREEGGRPFDLSCGPLLRVTLIALAREDYVLLLSMHHIVSDGWSMGVFYRELSVCYEAFTHGKPSPLTELPIQYADFALWQREWLRGEVFEAQLEYWRKQLANLSPLQLPTDRPRPALQTYRGRSQTFTLTRDLTNSLRALNRTEGVTLFMTLLAGFQVLLHRYSGQNDVAVGSPIAGRNVHETEQLIGFFVNALVLRTDLSGDPSFSEVLRRVREVALEAYAHQDVPFENLVEALNPERNLSYSPLFQVMFVLQNAPANAANFDGLGVTPFRIGGETAKFDLTLSLREIGDGLTGYLEYSTDLFDDDTIARMIGHFRTILEGVVASPARPISRLPLLTPSETAEILTGWNQTTVDYPDDCCIHECFEAQVNKRPDAVAVICHDERLTYAVLNARANQLARYLAKHGVQPGSSVGISMQRSIEMIVGVLAILKAGAAYVPLDPAWPAERLKFIVQDTDVRVLLTRQYESCIRDLNSSELELCPKLVLMDRDWEEIAAESAQNPAHETTPEHLAYVMYTSGSTGKPKGVEIPHRGVLRLLFGVDYAHFDPDETFLHLAPDAFDAATFEIWGALLHGARCIVAPASASLPQIGQLIATHHVTTLWLTASFFNAIIDDSPEILRGVRQLLTGGEALSVDHVRRALELLPDTQIINGYGPTESTTFACCYPIPRRLDLRVSSIPIGQSIGNTQIYILDEKLNPVPVGISGEIYIGGDGLARDYLNQPALTAEKFIPDPFSKKTGARLYKTGDRARYLPDGTLEFLGRFDQQVKIRGFRIEPGETGATLDQHPGIRESVVVFEDDISPNPVGSRNRILGPRMLAYVVRKGTDISAAELRDFLSKKLPEYMIPSVFVFVEALPLTVNGKVNRRALPPPNGSRPDLVRIYEGPRTPMEEILANIWAEVLKVNELGIHDNFFESGGHSLIATQAISRMNRVFQIEVPLRTMFETPTVAGVAEWIEQRRHNGQPVHLPALTAAPRHDPLPLSFAQQRLWFLDQLEPGRSVYNVPSATRVRGPLDVSALERSLNEIVKRHEALRTTFPSVAGEPVQMIAPSLSLSFQVTHLIGETEKERESQAKFAAREEAEKPFDLARGPLIRAMLLRLEEDDHVLLLTTHHIVFDGWSVGVLNRELSVLYDVYSKTGSSSLVDLPIQYGDFAVWQRQWLAGDVFRDQLSYWKRQLAGIPAVISLPLDRPRPAQQTYRGARQSFGLSTELTQKLKTLSRDRNATLFMTLLAAFQTLLYRYTGQNDIIVGSPIANRNRNEIENLIGFFVNTLVLRADFSKNPTYSELLAQVAETALQAYAHQDLPFEKLVEELSPNRVLSHSPIFQVMFSLQNAPTMTRQLGDLVCESFPASSQTAKFDITLSMDEEPEGLSGSLEYSTELFDAATIEQMLGHFVNLLKGIVADPHQRVSDLPLLSDVERDRLLYQWNITKTAYPKDKCVHDLFERQVEQTPGAIAITFGNQQLTYRELNEGANQLARYLQSSGVGPERLVGLFMERSLEMVVGLLGILKSGGAYLPLDPKYPKDRLAFMLEDSDARLLITQESLLASLPEHRARLICLDKDRSEINKESYKNPDFGSASDNLAYIIYTSGSTGKPKGVPIQHRSTVALLAWAHSVFTETELAGVLASTSITFDLSIFELFAPLTRGGTVILVPNALSLTTLTSALPVTLINSVPSAVAELLRANSIPASVTTINLAGEPLTSDLVKDLYAKTTAVKIYDLYGPSEDTTYSTFALRRASGPETIGRPISNTQVFVLDRWGQPVPMGVPGELYIGGDGLSRGYLNHPELTAEKFIPNPFTDEPGARLYKTGDRGRYLSDGNIQFLGRTDNQVKIRGYRVELGEIEAVLRRYPGVDEAVVLSEDERVESQKLVNGVSGRTRLVAYVVSASTHSAAELRSFLRQKLPEYMVPADFVFLHCMPLTPNGKVDRAVLRLSDTIAPKLADTFIAPRNDLERQLIRIYRKTLGIEKDVGIKDNFFELGGHSLLAVRLMDEIEKTLHKRVPVAALFQAPTVEEITKLIDEGPTTSIWNSLVPIQSGGSESPFFWVHGQNSTAFLPEYLGPDQPIYGLKHQSLDGAFAAYTTVETIASHYLTELQTIQQNGPYRLGGYCFGAVVAFEMAQQLKAQGQTVS
ncbi:MAG TPA: non-ribosomal peptide synthase/polyketide synthase, partial [Candidatus Binatia bacterium]